MMTQLITSAVFFVTDLYTSQNIQASDKKMAFVINFVEAVVLCFNWYLADKWTFKTPVFLSSNEKKGNETYSFRLV